MLKDREALAGCGPLATRNLTRQCLNTNTAGQSFQEHTCRPLAQGGRWDEGNQTADSRRENPGQPAKMGRTGSDEEDSEGVVFRVTLLPAVIGLGMIKLDLGPAPRWSGQRSLGPWTRKSGRSPCLQPPRDSVLRHGEECGL